MARSPFAASERRVAGLVLAAVLSVCVSLWTQAALAASGLASYLPKVAPADFFPGADRFGPPQGDPPIVPVYRGDQLQGFVYLNSDFANATGYSGKPIQLLVGIDPKGVLTGLKLVEHKEPIVLVGIPEKRILEAVNKLIGADMARVASGTAPAPASRHRQRRNGNRPGDRRQHRSLRDQADQERSARRPGQRGGRRGAASVEDHRSGEKRGSRLAESGRRRLRPATDPFGRRRQQGLRKDRQCRRGGASGGRRSGRHLHRPLCRRRRGADHRPQSARRRRLQSSGRPAEARTAGARRRRIRPLFLQGGRLRPGRNLRPDRTDPGNQQHPFPRPRPHPAGQPCGRRRAGFSRNRVVHGAGGVRVRSDRALGAATPGAARRRRPGQGLGHLRSRIHASRHLSQARGAAGAARSSGAAAKSPAPRPPEARSRYAAGRDRRGTAVDADLARRRRQDRHDGRRAWAR